ncbi:MAG: DUF262 domain-containing protein [Proteobacteria bacterium]|nr:DUF262 domain-containing protein [Candidatus Enterousia onthequi]
MTMRATLLENLTIRDLVNGYRDSGDNGVVALGGNLNVRPAFQREFVYAPDDRDRVVKSVYNNMPLNVMYWAKNPDGTYEIIDGQQRTISICQFVINDDGNGNPIAINFDGKRTQTFAGLSEEKQREILDNYKLQIYVCEGTDDEKLDWFHTINIAGKIMEEQELLNADYTGPWLTSAKSYFSKKTNNLAINSAYYNNDNKNTLLALTPDDANRQALLNLVLHWITGSENMKDSGLVKNYMAAHRFDDNADEMINYYKAVINWVKITFKEYRKDMKGLGWGFLYNKYHDNSYIPEEIESTLHNLYEQFENDGDGMHKSGFYEYVLSSDRTLIWKRIFSEKQQKQAYQNQNKRCGGRCGRELPFNQLEAHHKIAFADGGTTTIDNCLMLCHDCHADITAKQNHK